VTDVTVVDAVDTYLQRKALAGPDGSETGTYATNAESVLRRWAEWIERERGVTALLELGVKEMRAYAAELRARTEDGSYAASTAGTYYAVVRAFLSWCVRGGILDRNPAAADAAKAALPAAVDRDDDEWDDDRRRKLETYVHERALECSTSQGDREERMSRLREYALVALLARSDVRGAELFRVPDDDRRTGATWDDVDFYAGTIRVLGRAQRPEDVVLTAPVRTPLRRYRVALDPPSNDWPLFPTQHAPSVAHRLRTVLADRGHDDAEIDAILADSTTAEVARERAIAPPAITTEGARSILRRLCEAAGLDVDGESLTPRGLRSEHVVGYRREAASTTPALRASTVERAIAVPEQEPVIELDGGEATETSSEDAPDE
jgi:site-specific recombinase XerD